MVLSSPPSADTTPDSSNPERVLQSLYCAVSAPFSPGTGELDATLLEKDSPLSSSDISGMNIPTMTTTPTEGSMIDRFRSVQQSGLWSPKLNVGSRVPEASMSLSFYLLKTSGSQFVVG